MINDFNELFNYFISAINSHKEVKDSKASPDAGFSYHNFKSNNYKHEVDMKILKSRFDKYIINFLESSKKEDGPK